MTLIVTMKDMELDNELLPSGKKFDQAESPILSPYKLEVAAHGWQFLNSQGNISLLKTLQKIHEGDVEKTSPMDGNPTPNSLPPELNRFLFSDHASHLLKLEELEQYIAFSKQNITMIDATDTSGKTLYDFIPKESQKEIEDQLIRLSSTTNIKKALRADINSLAPLLWEDHKKIKAQLIPTLNLETKELFLGANASKKTTQDFENFLQEPDSLNIQEVSELVCLEKCRVAMAALTSSPKNKKEKEAEAKMLLGEDYPLLEAQMNHLQDVLQKDWNLANQTHADGQLTQPIIPSSGVELFCPKILSRMKNGPSADQIKTMDECFASVAYRKTDTDSPEFTNNSKVAFLLSSMNVLEQGTRGRSLNRLLTPPEIMGTDITSPNESSTELPDFDAEPNSNENSIPHSDSTTSKLKKLKGGEETLKKGILNVLQGSSKKVLAYGGALSLKHLSGAWKEAGPDMDDFVRKIKTADGDIDHSL